MVIAAGDVSAQATSKAAFKKATMRIAGETVGEIHEAQLSHQDTRRTAFRRCGTS